MVSKNYTQLGYLISFIPAIFVIYGNLTGGWIAGLNAVFALVVLVLLDWIMPEDTSHPKEISDIYADSILVIHVILQLMCVSTLLIGYKMGILTGWFLFLAILSTGINSGQSGIIVAHELIHRRNRLLRYLGFWNLLLVMYSHWFIEHKYGHHRWVGTYKDAATARYNESVYHFVVRTIPSQFVSAFLLESQRQIEKGRSAINPRNIVIVGHLLQLSLIVIVGVTFGMMGLLCFLGQALFAILLLEMVNYIEHYGLLREEDAPFVVELAWNTDIVSSRYFLLELVRHSDHHLRASKPYQTLVSYNEEVPCTVPTLPAGYWGVFYLTFFPKIWRRIIHPLIPPKMVDLHFKISGQVVPR